MDYNIKTARFYTYYITAKTLHTVVESSPEPVLLFCPTKCFFYTRPTKCGPNVNGKIQMGKKLSYSTL